MTNSKILNLFLRTLFEFVIPKSYNRRASSINFQMITVAILNESQPFPRIHVLLVIMTVFPVPKPGNLLSLVPGCLVSLLSGLLHPVP